MVDWLFISSNFPCFNHRTAGVGDPVTSHSKVMSEPITPTTGESGPFLPGCKKLH